MEPLPLTEITKLQLQQAVETYRAQVTALGQIFTALVIGDVTMLGFAAQYKLAILVASAGGFPLTMLFLFLIFARLSIPVLATAVSKRPAGAELTRLEGPPDRKSTRLN